MDYRIIFLIVFLSPLVFIILWMSFEFIKYFIKRNKEIKFIKKWRENNPPSNKIKNKFDWNWKYRYNENFENTNWCSNCRYWIKIDDGSSYEFIRGICKIRYKQLQNAEDATTTNYWNCKYYK